MLALRRSLGLLYVLVALGLFPSLGAAQSQIKPWFLFIVDTSGSMTSGAPANSCNYAPANRINAAKCAVYNVVSSSGDAEFGVLTFNESTSCSTSNCTDTGPAGQVRVNIGSSPYTTLNLVDHTGTGPANELCTGGYTPIGGTLMRAQDYLRGSTSPTIDDAAVGCRPISVILLTDGSECCGACANGWGDCTDFEATFSGDPDCPGGDCTCDAGCFTTASCDAEGFESGPERAHHLFGNTWVPPTSGDTCTSTPRTDPPADTDCVKLDVRTYVIGFGDAISPGDQYIERLAIGGRTDNPDPNYRGFYAANETELSAALTQIILDSQISEVCDGIDNDCDSKVDEDWPKYCDVNDIRTANPMVTNPLDPGGPLIDQADVVGPLGDISNLAGCDAQSGCDVPGEQENTACDDPEWSSSSTCTPPNILCESPGEECNVEDDDCDGKVDENAPELVCPCCDVETCEPCDLVDNDCDGKVDENQCPPCFPEICDDIDNDCDGETDEGLTRSCGTDVGECTAGQQVCQPFCPEGAPCWGAVNPMTSMWEYGFCPSDGPFTEQCNNLDDNCDGVIDRIQQPCSPYGTTGECEPGTEMCIGGVWQFSHGAGTGDDVPANCTGARGPTIEICDTQDDDCDGDTDEYNPGAMPPELLPGVGLTCGNGLGICDPGQTVCASASTCPDCFGGQCVGSLASCTVDGTCAECTAGTVVCQDDDDSMTEVCNGLDDDCDGKIDENPGGNSLPDVGVDCYPVDPDTYPPPPYTGACDGSDPACLDLGVTAMPLGICSEGTSACLGGNIVCENWDGPERELCDSIDQDCDGDPITTLDDPIVGQSCGTSIGVCDLGMYFCNAATEMIECDALRICPGDPACVEVCNSLDDDCDGKVDEDTDTLAPCDYDPDNDPALIPEEGLCQHGETRCVGGEEICDGAIGPSGEICDCDDNDCDGTSDEYDPGAMPPKLIPGVGEDCGTDVGICVTGTTVCDADTCGIECPDDTEPCNGAMPCNELCNALDDDCDGLTDEGNPEGGNQCGVVPSCRRSVDPDSGGTLDQPCGECRFGNEVCMTSADAADAGMPCGGGDPACLVCVGHVGPKDELCNGLDDDCDYPCLDVDPFDAIPPNCPADPCTTGTDCNQWIDEGVDVTDPEVGELCGDPTGECDEGNFVCLDGILECQGATGPEPEMCNMKDDDCDTRTDEGIPVGDPCGMDVGECQPGVQTCDRDTGMIECTGGVQPIPEVCDSLDNDCDGKIDESLGLGDVCGTDVGECMTGQLQCDMGKIKCVGEIPPGLEVCDCLDNDCDGKVDEEAGANPICPGDSACIMCQCALPCIVLPEFGETCPQGKAPLDQDGQCFCVGATCNPSECAAQTISDDQGTVLCGPSEEQVGTCACRNNACNFRCSGVVCPQGLVCDPTDGACREANCLLPQFACPEHEVCQQTDGIWDCVADPCADVSCAAAEACRDGDCVGSCAKVSCPSGDKCIDGDCVTDECAGVSCGPGLLCNPADGECVVPGACVKSGCASGEICEPIGGECVSDPCLVTQCPVGERCDSATGQCESRCGPGFLFCDEACVDPRSSKTNCGATDDCMGDNAGSACADEEVCSEGVCGTECASGLVNCGGECINPNTDRNHCGASGECTGAGIGTVCETGKSCRNGACIDNSMLDVDAGDGPGAAGPVPDTETRVIVTGGGGCKCAVPGSAVPASGGGTRAGALAWLLVGLALLRLRRRSFAVSLRALPRGLGLGLVAILAALPGEGCKVEPFCLTCPPEGTGGTGPAEDGGGAGTGGSEDGGGAATGGTGGTSGGTGGDGGPVGDGGGTGGTGGGADTCIDVELCNDIDDDCDGTVNEDVDPAAQNIDLDTDLFNCGECGVPCAPLHAIGKCVGGTCGVDLCDVGWHDLDGKPDNGCEYSCFKQTSDDSVCDRRDDDCDGSVDEDIDFETDIDHCGSCGFECVFIHAADGASCEQGECVLDPNECDPGFHDVDGNPLNGCEYSCTPANPATERCNATDDDCDRKVDEGVAATDPEIGVECPGGINTGPCNAGTTVCTGGAVQCQGGIGPTPEVCDGIDNDCNAAFDEDDPRLGLACGSSIGACERGNLTCENVSGNKELVCTGGVLPADDEICNGVDDDCDGQTDNSPLSVGLPCRTAANGQILIDPGDPTGECVNGEVACEQNTLKCIDETKPSPELCDDVDQDCDGNPINGVNATDPAIGQPCGKETGECDPGVTQCNGGIQVCMGGQTPVAEVCNGLDDDCDGAFDNVSHVDPDDPLSPLDPVTPIGIGLPCRFPLSVTDTECELVPPLEFCFGNDVVAAGECVVGTTTCAGGQVACPDYVGPTPEKCDADDQDCDGDPANGVALTDNLVGAACDADSNTTGICNTGTTVCNTSGADPVIQCTGEVFADVGGELCDGVDNDCDGLGDDGEDEAWITTPTTCKTNLTTGDIELGAAPVAGTCSLGTPVCITGALQCQGEIFPGVEVCDGAGFGSIYNAAHDQDCNGKVDEDFDLENNAQRCGTCNNDCTTIDANANWLCTNGTCDISSCKSGYFDDKTNPGEDCDIGPGDCTFAGAEVCDATDNDCDGLIDEDTGLEPLNLPDPLVFCPQQGACAGSDVECRTHLSGDPDADDPADCPLGYDDPGCDTEPVCTIRPTDETCNAPWNMEAQDAYDDNCNGINDDVEFGLTGLSAVCQYNDPGVFGACRTSGNLACNLTTMADVLDTYCDDGTGAPVAAGTPGDESNCDGIDDDCDDNVDEACGYSSDMNCVDDAWVTLPVLGTEIYAYEASRLDASSTGSGSTNDRACSVPGRLPWGNITWQEAQDACLAADPDGRLCTEEEWQEACEYTGATACTWSFTSTCTVYGTTNDDTCNGLDFVQDPMTNDIEPTGWAGLGATTSSCSRPQSGESVFDQSGNVREYVDLRLDGAIPVRGGANNSPSTGMTCQFDFPVWPDTDTAKFFNTGFRCCRGTPPPRCAEFVSDNMPAAGNNSDITTSFVVPALAGSPLITDVNVTIDGFHTDFEAIELIRLTSPASTNVSLHSTTNVCGTGVDGFALRFDDEVTPTALSCTAPVGNYIWTKPDSPLSAFDGQTPSGTWTLYFDDQELNDGAWSVTGFTLRICAE